MVHTLQGQKYYKIMYPLNHSKEVTTYAQWLEMMDIYNTIEFSRVTIKSLVKKPMLK